MEIGFHLGRAAGQLSELLIDLVKQGHPHYAIRMAVGYVYAHVEDSSGTDVGYCIGKAETQLQMDKENLSMQNSFEEAVRRAQVVFLGSSDVPPPPDGPQMPAKLQELLSNLGSKKPGEA